MKKIGILTFHRSINYGAFMQSYSLAHQLMKRYGNVVEIIDFEKASKHNAYHPKQSLYHMLVFGSDRVKMTNRFNDDLKLLPLSKESLITDNYDDVRRFIEGRYDIVIVGSDAVWAYNKGSLGLRNPYWLFGSSLNCEKLSYAASAFSLDLSRIPDEDKQYIAECLSSFSYIGVRDKETENLVKMCLPNATVYRNCDPTILLDKPNEEFANTVYNKFHLNPRKKLVTIMMGVYEPIIYDVINRYGRKQYEYCYLFNRMRAKERFLPSAPRFLYDLSPFEWYHLFGKSYLNLTTFFHGTLLALKSNVPTITFDTNDIEGSYTSKIKQIMYDIDLQNYYNCYLDGISKKNIFDEIDDVLSKHDMIEALIETNLMKEAKRANSFFEKLDKSL